MVESSLCFAKNERLVQGAVVHYKTRYSVTPTTWKTKNRGRKTIKQRFIVTKLNGFFVFLLFVEGVISYSVIQGDIKDVGYDGREEGGILVGGIGQLCDGRHGANEPFTKSKSNSRLKKIRACIIKYGGADREVFFF